MLQKLINIGSQNPQKLFLVDCLGAMLTAFSIGVVLVQLEAYIGMPSAVLYPLSFVACVFALYSGLCFVLLKKNYAKFIQLIATANTLYCIVSLVLVANHYAGLTALGLTYFVGEIIIVLTLAYIEFRVAAVIA